MARRNALSSLSARHLIAPALAALVVSTLGVAAADPATSAPVATERRALATHPHPRTRLLRPVRASGANAIADPGFESGFTAWRQCGNVNASITSAKPHTGTYAAKSGSTAGEPAGDEGVCQAVLVPPNARLTFWVAQYSNEPNTAFAYQEAQLFDANGQTVKQLYQTADTTDGWTQRSYDLSEFAGRNLYLYFGVHGDGYAGSYAIQFVDDVSLTSEPAPAS
jgi:hypothetical protein